MAGMTEVPTWIQGVWRRERVERGDGSVDRDTRVIWLQTPTLYADIRIPKVRRSPAGQQGFAGWLTVVGQVCTWHRPIDRQPPTRPPDVGTMFRRGRRMIECGVHANYLEDWRLLDDGQGRFLALARGAGKMQELLVMAGHHFIAAAAASEHRAYELSYGRIDRRTREWRIELSTARAREGRALFTGETWRFDIERGIALQRLRKRSLARRRRLCTCTLPPRELAGLFAE